jgi:pyruvate dehydrogenase E2 component (dihydrolipoamide acetyltransferase)
MIEFRMPSLGADMEAGTLVEWLKKPGDALARGDIIAVVDTQKGAIEIEVFNGGILDRVLVQPGQKVPVGTPMASIRASDEPSAVAVAPTLTIPVPTPAVRVSPAARKAADELHVELATVEGHGPGGAVTVADVERAAGRGRSAAGPAERTAAMRSAIGAAMARAKREIPHLYLSSTVDVTPALTWLSSENARRSVVDRLLPVVLFIKAVGRACVEVPSLNGYWADGAFAAGAGVHIGCAIALRDGGLVAPALHDVHNKSLDGVGREFADLVARTRAGGLRSSEMSDATITLTNLGELGVDSAYAIITPPQVAIVAFGRIVERPWVVDGRVEPRSVVTVSVSADHRVVDGRTAGSFLLAIERALQAPGKL